MGTPEFAVMPLVRLYEDGHEIVAVFTQPDKARNRGMKVSYGPVKETALARNTPCFQLKSLRTAAAAEIIRGLNCDIIVVVAYGKLLPKSILEIPPHGCINIHASLLPKYRGAAPIHWAIINGESISGVTAIQMDEALDEGDIILAKSTPIGEEETSAQLHDRLSLLGASLLSETLDEIATGRASRTAQNHKEATYAPSIDKGISPIDWTDTARQIKQKVQGLNSWPVATAMIGGIAHKIYSVDIDENALAQGDIGDIVYAGPQGISIVCADGVVTIKELQAPNGKRMSAADYLRGRKIPNSTVSR